MSRRWWFVDGAWSSFFHREVQPTSSFPHCQRFSRQFHITIPRQNMLMFNTMFTAQAALSLRALHAFLERIYRINGYECHTCLVFVNMSFFENTSEKTQFFFDTYQKTSTITIFIKYIITYHNHIYLCYVFLEIRSSLCCVSPAAWAMTCAWRSWRGACGASPRTSGRAKRRRSCTAGARSAHGRSGRSGGSRRSCSRQFPEKQKTWRYMENIGNVIIPTDSYFSGG